MSSVEETLAKEKGNEYYVFFLSYINKKIKDRLEDLINDAIVDCEKKLAQAYPNKDSKSCLGKMRDSFSNVISKSRMELDKVIDEALKRPSHPEIRDIARKNEKYIEEIRDLEIKLTTVHQYHMELLKSELEMATSNIPEFYEESNDLMKIEATSSQRLSDLQVMADLFKEKNAVCTNELEDSVMNMSIE